jgi:uncharacterized repeat protein (TIGR03803 family)
MQNATRINAMVRKSSLAFAILLMYLLLAVPIPAHAQSYRVIYRFRNTDGAFPYGGLAIDTNGSLYGTTSQGGAYGSGTIFRINRTREAVLHSFPAPRRLRDGMYPLGDLVRDSSGNLYGTTAFGGNSYGGSVFKLDSSNKETVLYSLGADGVQPQGSVIFDTAGNLYTTSVLNNHFTAGTAFKVSPTGIETGLLSNPSDYLYAGLIIDVSGNLYGTTTGDGVSTFGTVFKISPSGNVTYLYSFTGGLDGALPMSTLTLDAGGNLYGTTTAGGSLGLGTVFKVDVNGIESVMYSFLGGSDGAQPHCKLFLDNLGNFWGTTVLGGSYNLGTIFRLKANGTESVLHSFAGGSDGQYPYAGLAADSKGNLYGTTAEGGANYGTVFRVSP